jgi:carboxypeptidase PM20D1
MRRFLIGLAALVAVIVVVVLARTLTNTPPARPEIKPTMVEKVDGMDVARHLAAVVRFKTVSYGYDAPDAARKEAAKFAELDGLRAYLERTYPNLHRVASREIFEKSLLFVWPGKDRKAPPVLMMAHMDVVPVVPGTETQWQHGPFSGDIAGGYVWGRGATDDKGSLIAILDAAERLAADDFVPARTIYFAFGQDEEVGGRRGEKVIAAALARRGVHFAWALDEGGAIATEPFPGVAQPVVFISVGEKGYLSLKLVAHGTPGHSSRPTGDMAIVRLAKAIQKVVASPFASGLDGVQREKLEVLAPYTPFSTRMVLSNMWLFGGYAESNMGSKPDGAARLHTTISPTILAAGIKDNVIPPDASATINFRLHARDRIEGVIAHVKNAIGDRKVDVIALSETRSNASRIADLNGPAGRFLVHEIQSTWPYPVAPDTTTGATDSKHFLPIADAVFRLTPFRIGPQDLGRVHGTNERTAVADLADAVTFYMRVMKDLK